MLWIVRTVGAYVSETSNGFGNRSVQFLVLYLPVGRVYTVLRCSMINHLVGASEPERLAGGGAGHASSLTKVSFCRACKN